MLFRSTDNTPDSIEVTAACINDRELKPRSVSFDFNQFASDSKVVIAICENEGGVAMENEVSLESLGDSGMGQMIDNDIYFKQQDKKLVRCVTNAKNRVDGLIEILSCSVSASGSFS